MKKRIILLGISSSIIIICLVIISFVLFKQVHKEKYITIGEAIVDAFLAPTDGEGRTFFDVTTALSIANAYEHEVIATDLTEQDMNILLITVLKGGEELDEKIEKDKYEQWLEEKVDYVYTEGTVKKMTRERGINLANNEVIEELGIGE